MNEDVNMINFEPFAPNLTSTHKKIKPLEITHNLHDTKNLEFDHQYLTDHLEALGLSPNLCGR